MRRTARNVWTLVAATIAGSIACTALAEAPLVGADPPGRLAPQPAAAGGSPSLPNPILFVTQFPTPYDFAARASVFGNHRGTVEGVGRGGDLWIRYPDGTMRNLTAEAGFGEPSGFQGEDSIAVREPSVHWDGDKAVFSMVVGAPPEQFEHTHDVWQLYEVTGLEPGGTAVITPVPGQPEGYNNLSPVYTVDDRILFTSDHPRDGQAHLHPLLDEYEEVPVVSGLWSLDPATGELGLLDFAPSGDFSPLVDSFGRVVFTRWDHLQRDQQADTDVLEGNTYGTFDYADETAGAERLEERVEVFPEPRPVRTDLLEGTNLEGHRFNHFFPWMVNPDGTELEALGHVGRHELHEYFNRAINDDPNVVEFIAAASGRFNPNPIENLLQIAEDPTAPGRYLGVDAPEFQTQGSGLIAALTLPPGQAPDAVAVDYLTHPSTRTVTGPGEPAPPGHSGHYRDPLVLSDGTLIAAHTPETGAAGNDGTRAFPDSRYDYRLRVLEPGPGGYLVAGVELTAGISKSVSYWDPDVLVQYSGPFWELEAVEVAARPRPPVPTAELPGPEQQVFAQEGVDPQALRDYLASRSLALIVTRDVTTRDGHDRQQPFNLRVPGGTQTTGAPGTLYDVSHLQIFQADHLRGLGGTADPDPGRRILARTLHDSAAVNPPAPGAPEGAVTVAPDGSAAAFVPAHRPLAWQLTAPDGTPVVRERYWLTFQPGEIRVCTSCHGPSSADQAGQPPPVNPPQALATLLAFWAAELAPLFEDGFESGDTTAWTTSTP